MDRGRFTFSLPFAYDSVECAASVSNMTVQFKLHNSLPEGCGSIFLLNNGKES